MNNIITYFDFSELALAAYSDLYSGMIRADYELALRRDGDGMAQKQAEAFAENWTVLDQYDGMVEETYSDDFGVNSTFLTPTGLSATIFEDSDGNQVVAIRGTEITDLYDVATDIIDVACLGTPENQAQYLALSTQVQKWLDDGTLHSGFSVTGHSLGGFLALALTEQFGPYVSETYTYNAPGFSVQDDLTNIETELLDIFGVVDATIPNNKITNIRALEGPSATSGLGQMIGSIQPIYIEDQSPNWVANHYMVHLSDALAVYNLFASIDSSLTIDTITSLLSSSANEADRTLESAVSDVGELLLPSFTARTGSEYNTNRDLLYQDLHDITITLKNRSGLSIEILGSTAADGSFTPDFPTKIKGLAYKDIAYRYALVNGNPFVILGDDSHRYPLLNLSSFPITHVDERHDTHIQKVAA